MASLVRVSIVIAGLLCCFLGTPSAFAGQDLNKCKKSSDEHVQKCMEHKTQAEGQNAAQAQAAGKAATTNINPNAGASKQVNQDAANRLNDAKNKCEKEKKECEKDCDDAKKSADQKVQQGQSQKPPCSQSPCPEAKADQPQIEPTKESACMAPIAAIMGPLGSGANDAQNAANGDGKTGGQSGGMPPIPPVPPKSDDKPTPTPTTDPVAADKQACTTDPNATALSKCNETLVQKCTPGLTVAAQNDPTCEAFTARFCSTAPTDSTTNATDSSTSGAGRAGEGVATNFCKTAIARNFCQSPGRSQCATCQNYRNLVSDECKTNPSACQTTPFGSSCPDVEPPMVGGIPVTTPTGDDHMSGGGSGSGSSGGSGGDRYSTPTVPAKEGAAVGNSGPKMDLAVSEGGGSGSGGSGNEDTYSSKYRTSSYRALAGAKPASVVTRSPASADVATVGGPSLFFISSTTIKNMCANNRLRHCGRN